MKSVINVTFSAVNEKGARGFVELLRNNVTHDSMWHQVNEKYVKYGDQQMGSYWIGTASLTVDAGDLNNRLVQVDTVKHGFIPDASEVYSEVHKDVRVEVATEGVDSIVPILEQNKYLHNLVQEHARALATLEYSHFNLTKINESQEARIQELERGYAEIQAFLHSHIDFTALKQIVRATAEAVDESILDDFPLQRLH